MPLKRLLMENPLNILSESESEAIAKDVVSQLDAKQFQVIVSHSMRTHTDFSRNDVRNVAGDAQTIVQVSVNTDGYWGGGGTNLVDREGLHGFLADLQARTKAHHVGYSRDMALTPPTAFTDPPIYFESTMNAGDPEWQGELARKAMDVTAKAGVIGAGNLTVGAGSIYSTNSIGFKGYSRSTTGELSLTARTTSQKGSGWSWTGGEDILHLDIDGVTAEAIDIAKRSDNPVALEPGRYTVILEPQALSDLMGMVTDWPTMYMDAEYADQGITVFSKPGGGNKIGLKMTDDRGLFVSDPMDPIVPISPLEPGGGFLSRTPWIEQGMLKNLVYGLEYGKKKNRAQVDRPGNARLEFSGTTNTRDEMIATTKRGIWVHRFSGVTRLSALTLLLTGVTRDGTFLIENGKISKPIKNLRFSESPFFILNKLDMFGPPVRTAGGMAIPRIKVHDFEFTSLSDAV